MNKIYKKYVVNMAKLVPKSNMRLTEKQFLIQLTLHEQKLNKALRAAKNDSERCMIYNCYSTVVSALISSRLHTLDVQLEIKSEEKRFVANHR